MEVDRAIKLSRMESVRFQIGRIASEQSHILGFPEEPGSGQTGLERLHGNSRKQWQAFVRIVGHQLFECIPDHACSL